MPSNKVFRKAALDRLASPEQLHTLMRVTDAKGWLALLGCALIILTALLWSIFGTLQTKVSASGILLSGGALAEVTAVSEGQIASVEIEAGDNLKKGQLVARIAQPFLEKDIESLRRRLAELPQAQDAGVAGAAGASAGDARRRLELKIAGLERQLKANSALLSALDGRVVEVRAAVGDRVVPGTPIAAVERLGQEQKLEALLYFDSHRGKAMKPGMEIELSPSVVRKERHGVLLGRVRSVEDFPSTRRGMMGALRNEQLVESFIQEAGGAPIAVRAELITDSTTQSGFRWSSGKGPPVVLTSGTRLAGAVITRTQRPIALVFPALDYGG